MLRIKQLALTATAGLLLATPPLVAQSTNPLTVHGYLSQGYAVASDNPVNGIPVRGTSDYRAAALQFRYDLTPGDAFVLQFSHRRLGVNPLQNAEDAVTLDWGFYQHRFATGTAVKLGKFAIPRGIYSETRDVGTILPFFRAPINFYYEGIETLDGIGVNHRQRVGAFGLDVSVYGGSADYVSVTRTPTLAITSAIDVDRGVGGWGWLETPISGVRIGAGLIDFHAFAPVPGTTPRELDGKLSQVSLDVTRARGFVRSEFSSLTSEMAGTEMTQQSYYAQGSLNVTEQLSLTAQADYLRGKNAGASWGRRSVDHALGVNVALNPGLVLKLEGHTTRGFNNFDRFVSPVGPAVAAKYVISSVSVSF
ncbi:MAG TPA: hypothetical protein VEA99_21650 [Gemmatimonadaceae bacterium]|nr:hypothetical protein [Gemmatimonadaceae bacterium]